MFEVGDIVKVKDRFWDIPSQITPDPDHIMYKHAGLTSMIIS